MVNVRVLVVAPHPDDEVLGAGGTIHRWSKEGFHITVAIATRGWAPLFDDAQVSRVREEAERANELLGVRDLVFMDLPVAKLSELPRYEINHAFANLIADTSPHTVLLPHPSDLHRDHLEVFEACQVALRPLPGRLNVRRIWCYETVSETHWSPPGVAPCFEPQVYVDISGSLGAKLKAFRAYASQNQPEPQARSPKALEALATFRGSVMNMAAAEAFVCVRERLA